MRLEPCEVWLIFAEDPDLAPCLHPLRGKITPAQPDCVVYNEDDLLWLQGDEEAAAVRDEESDIS